MNFRCYTDCPTEENYTVRQMPKKKKKHSADEDLVKWLNEPEQLLNGPRFETAFSTAISKVKYKLSASIEQCEHPKDDSDHEETFKLYPRK